MTFQMQKQRMRLWCWAAVASSTRNYFTPGSPREQCDIATPVLGIPGTDCCTRPNDCNRTYFLQDALVEVGCVDRYGPGVIPFHQIVAELQHGYPIAARIAWQGGAAHFVLITGCFPSTRVVAISDPQYGTTTNWPFDRFATAYRWLGRWTDTFLLRP